MRTVELLYIFVGKKSLLSESIKKVTISHQPLFIIIRVRSFYLKWASPTEQAGSSSSSSWPDDDDVLSDHVALVAFPILSAHEFITTE